MRYFKLIIVSLTLLLGCMNNRDANNETILAKKYDKAFKGINKDVIASAKTSGKELFVSLNIKSPSLIDSESQQLMLCYVGFILFNELKEYNIINYTVVDEGLENDILHYKVNNDNLSHMCILFSKDECYRKVVIYLLKNITNDENVRANIVINELFKLMPDRFKYNGSFWGLLQDYSVNTNSNYYNVFKWAIKADHDIFRYKHINAIDSIYNNCSKYKE